MRMQDSVLGYENKFYLKNLKCSGYYIAYCGSFGCSFLGNKTKNILNQQTWRHSKKMPKGS
jgi:hypothetical protein